MKTSEALSIPAPGEQRARRRERVLSFVPEHPFYEQGADSNKTEDK